MSRETKARLKLTSARKSSQAGPVLLIGNGPSTKDLTIAQVERFRSLGGQIAVMNGFADSYLSKIIVPDYYFIMDLNYWRPSNTSDFEHLERIRQFMSRNAPDCIFVQPANQPCLLSKHENFMFVDGRSVAGLYRSARPDRPWGLPGSVAMTAIATLQFIGHPIVYFTGLDSDGFRHYFVNDMNQLIWDSRKYYFYEDIAFQKNRPEIIEPGVIQVPAGLINNFADVLYSEAVFRKDLYWLMKDNCVNVGNDRTNDSAPRACLLG